MGKPIHGSYSPHNLIVKHVKIKWAWWKMQSLPCCLALLPCLAIPCCLPFFSFFALGNAIGRQSWAISSDFWFKLLGKTTTMSSFRLQKEPGTSLFGGRKIQIHPDDSEKFAWHLSRAAQVFTGRSLRIEPGTSRISRQKKNIMADMKQLPSCHFFGTIAVLKGPQKATTTQSGVQTTK